MELEDSEKIFLEQFKLKKLISKLEKLEGNGTSLISLVIPPNKKISDYTQMLTDELGKADNIKDRSNRNSVITAISSAKERLKPILKTSPKGLCIFCGQVLLEDGTEKKVCFDIEPYKPINSKLYKCADRFQLDNLKALLDNYDKFGFVIVDGAGCLFGTLQGNTKTIVSQLDVNLPKKHNKGGQSSNRFQHIRLEKRLIYTKKICSLITHHFITNDVPNVKGLILAGYADFKTLVYENSTFDNRLKDRVLKTLDISYGGIEGFNQAISLSQDVFKGVKLVQEQEILNKFYKDINLDIGKIVYGHQDTINALEENAIETIIIFEKLDIMRITLKNDNGEETIKYLKESTFENIKNQGFTDDKGNKLKLEDAEPLIDWITENYEKYNISIKFVSNYSPEGNQFEKGFGGIGALLKFKPTNFNNYNYQDDSEDSDDEGFI